MIFERIWGRWRFFFVACMIMITASSAQTYFYPIVCCTTSSILLMQQHKDGSLTLLAWDILTNQAHSILPGYYYPVNVTLLPDHSGVSFIDNDRLRIKYFAKKSALTCDIPYPLYNVSSLTCSEGHELFFMAQYHGRYAVLRGSTTKPLQINIMADDHAEYLYPQGIDGYLWYIKRDQQDSGCHYSIERVQYSGHEPHRDVCDGDIKQLIDSSCKIETLPVQSPCTIADFGQRPIMHLHMIDAHLGWVIGLPVDTSLSNWTFPCYLLQSNEDIWSIMQIFEFTIPRSLLTPGQSKLSESLIPLLPRFIRGAVYFCNINDNHFLGIYRYSLTSGTIEQLTNTSIQTHLFAPLELGSMVICGSEGDDRIWQVFDEPQVKSTNKSFKLNF